MAISFAVDDLRTPESTERVLRQFERAIQSAAQVKPAVTTENITQITNRVATTIQQQLQATGSNPLNLQSLLPSLTSAVIAQGDHASRLAVTSTALLYFETDRRVLYASVSNVWEYAGGVYTDVFANRPTDLGSSDIGFLFDATDQSTAYVWTGAAWDTASKRILFTANFAIWAATLTADRTYTLPDATGNIPYETANITNGNIVLGGGGALIKDSTIALPGTLFSGTVTLAKITAGGSNGSLTVSNGFITAYTAPT